MIKDIDRRRWVLWYILDTIYVSLKFEQDMYSRSVRYVDYDFAGYLIIGYLFAHSRGLVR